MRRLIFVSCTALLAAVCSSAIAVECAMSEAFKQPDSNARKQLTSVWQDSDASSLLFVESLNVNTDGTRRSYKVDDFWGEKEAFNNLCNAMSDACRGLKTEAEQRGRRIITQTAAANGWPRDQLALTKISSSIIPFRDGKPCPPKDGYLISATSLHNPEVQDVCDIDRYVDALVTPALVLPKPPKGKNLSRFGKLNAKIGDLVVAMVPGSLQPVFAVVGDHGPADALGEGSIALNGQLLGKTALPVNYREIRGRAPYRGQGWTVPKSIVLIFPGTRDQNAPYLTPERINAAARERFESWGGVGRMYACAAAYQD
ncbi:hypothetical protein KY495_16090 [Massilia sp. PAMC28688]|uniref:glycoside hydrolase family 75 protein n=1 Tax=Massilia sp. PAMC28688 TaxID=2861283 RepID=UPI001C62F2B9|nr:glycoside hydrolase family 75 protein [Massilia sp. PAMC28688]QYF92270.1 hypothetical protein KY495_16090 [Massilia sp. PAMC28688]